MEYLLRICLIHTQYDIVLITSNPKATSLTEQRAFMTLPYHCSNKKPLEDVMIANLYAVEVRRKT